jgi:hypothetical protein
MVLKNPIDTYDPLQRQLQHLAIDKGKLTRRPK